MNAGRNPGLTGVHACFARRRALDADTSFFEAGFTSALLAEVLEDLRDEGFTVSLVDLYRYPTVRSLSASLGFGERRSPAAPPWLGASRNPVTVLSPGPSIGSADGPV
ncbi:acyl carrier protein [Actinoplanes sp. NPDC026619]|uniref:acyl carrier protein n=1 Tax=Actinoplanes sp. NPDC026619 TaxID=3155798 RepID=UPI0033EB2206